jgi:voltage-gated potassium channel
MPWLDSLYMTVMTITTVGYAEVKPLDTSERGGLKIASSG